MEQISKSKAVPLQAWSGTEASRKLRFPDFVTMAQDGGRLLALRTGKKSRILKVFFLVNPCYSFMLIAL